MTLYSHSPHLHSFQQLFPPHENQPFSRVTQIPKCWSGVACQTIMTPSRRKKLPYYRCLEAPFLCDANFLHVDVEMFSAALHPLLLLGKTCHKNSHKNLRPLRNSKKLMRSITTVVNWVTCSSTKFPYKCNEKCLETIIPSREIPTSHHVPENRVWLLNRSFCFQ